MLPYTSIANKEELNNKNSQYLCLFNWKGAKQDLILDYSFLETIIAFSLLIRLFSLTAFLLSLIIYCTSLRSQCNSQSTSSSQYWNHDFLNKFCPIKVCFISLKVTQDQFTTTRLSIKKITHQQFSFRIVFSIPNHTPFPGQVSTYMMRIRWIALSLGILT